MLERLTRAIHAFTEAPEKPPKYSGGFSGPPLHAGQLSIDDQDRFEYATQMADRSTRLKKWLTMRLSDADTSLLWWIPTIAVTMAPWRIDKAKIPEGEGVPNNLQKIYDEQAAFVQWNLLGDEGTAGQNGMKRSWKRAISENMVFTADGAGVFELEWRMHEDREKYYLYWPHYRPLSSIEEWFEKDGELYEIVQEGGYGDGVKSTPSRMLESNCLHLVYMPLGNNHEGMSVFRCAWKTYEMMFATEKIEVMSAERHGMGVDWIGWDGEKVTPTIEIDEKTGKQTMYIAGNTIAELEDMLKGVRAHEKLFMITGPLDYEIKGPQGNMPDLRKNIEGYQKKIMRAGIQHFLTLGSAAGSWALADVQQSPFWNYIAYVAGIPQGEYQRKVIKPLIDYNWPRQEVQLYPTLKCDVDKVDTQAYAAAISNILKVGFPQYPELHKWIAQVIGAPAPPDEEEAKAKSVVVPKGGTDEDDEDVDGQKQHEFREWKPYRKLRPEEEHVAFADIVKSLDNYRAELNKRLDVIRKKRISWVRNKIENMSGEQLKEPEIVSPVDVPFKDQIKTTVADYLKMVIGYGRNQVRAELKKLGRKVAAWETFSEPFKWPTINMGVMLDTDTGKEKSVWVFQEFTETEFLLYLGEQIERWATNWFMGSVLNNARQSIMAGDNPRDVAYAVFSALENASIKEREKEIGRYVNQSFGWGRESEFYNNRKVIKEARRSAVGDDNVCAHCRSMDGNTFEYPSEEYYADHLPDKDCQGGDACRCIHVIM